MLKAPRPGSVLSRAPETIEVAFDVLTFGSPPMHPPLVDRARARPGRRPDLEGRVDEDAAVLVLELHLDRDGRHAEGRLRILCRDLAPDIGHVTLERGRAELRLRVPDVAVVACPEGDGVVRPGTHRRAVTVGPVHADFSGALVVDVAARGAHE